MKRLSITLLITLILTANTYAKVAVKQEVLIYSFTEQSTDYTCDFNGSDISEIDNLPWEKTTVKKTGFVALQEIASSQMEAWFVYTYKAPDANGKMQKYAQPELQALYVHTYAHIGDTKIWLLSTHALEWHVELNGVTKEIFIKAVDKYADIPTTIAGMNTWNYLSNEQLVHEGASTLKMRYHSKFTNAYYADPAVLDAYSAIENVLGEYLRGKGYIVLPLKIP